MSETIREERERLENEILCPFATKSVMSAGRARPEEKCSIRTDFQRDRDRITHSKSFRRLMHKTQVFISPEGDHYRTRLTHTLEVAQIARTISRALCLNEDLTEAIALGHDLGHTPFGHTGEDALDSILLEGFRHNEQSVRVVEFLENGGQGLNLTREVVDGIFTHRTECTPKTIEAEVVQLSDKIGYINHDIDDSLRAGLLRSDELPAECLEVLGVNSRERINCLVTSVIENSKGKPHIELRDEYREALAMLRDYMYGTVYQHQLQQTERKKIRSMLKDIFDYYMEDLSRLPKDFRFLPGIESNPARIVCDYIAGMTDRFAARLFMQIKVPSSWNH